MSAHACVCWLIYIHIITCRGNYSCGRQSCLAMESGYRLGASVIVLLKLFRTMLQIFANHMLSVVYPIMLLKSSHGKYHHKLIYAYIIDILTPGTWG